MFTKMTEMVLCSIRTVHDILVELRWVVRGDAYAVLDCSDVCLRRPLGGACEHVHRSEMSVLVDSTHFETELKILKRPSLSSRHCASHGVSEILCPVFSWQCGEYSTHKFPTSMNVNHVHS